jgi:hypothetical protein
VTVALCHRCNDLAPVTADDQRRPICASCRTAEHDRWVRADGAEWKDHLELEDCDGGDW